MNDPRQALLPLVALLLLVACGDDDPIRPSGGGDPATGTLELSTDVIN